MSLAPLHQFASKKITRKEFLFYIVLVIFSLSGVSHVLSSFTNPSRSFFDNNTKGFGSGSYGGKEKA